MDELKLLIEMVANLPSLAVWVLAGYLLYKIAVIGSVYGLIRFAIDRFHNYKTAPKEFKFGSRFIGTATAEQLQLQITRLAGASNAIHETDIKRLKELLDKELGK